MDRFRYRGGCCVHGRTRIKVFKRRAGLSYSRDENSSQPSAITNQLKVTVLLINNFVGAKVYCLKLALLCLFCVKWT